MCVMRDCAINIQVSDTFSGHLLTARFGKVLSAEASMMHKGGIQSGLTSLVKPFLSYKFDILANIGRLVLSFTKQYRLSVSVFVFIAESAHLGTRTLYFHHAYMGSYARSRKATTPYGRVFRLI